MKKILSIIALVLVLSSCKKSNDEQFNAKELIVGNWVSNRQTYTHFDENDNVISNISDYRIIDLSFTRTTAKDNINNISENYSFVSLPGGFYYSLSFSGNKISEIQPVTISYFGNKMDWSIESTDPKYTTYEIDGVEKKASKIKVVYIFQKK